MIEHDVLIIGGGLAGMSAALHAKQAGADVAMLSKVYPTRSHSAAAQGGINSAIGVEDSWEVHAYETVNWNTNNLMPLAIMTHHMRCRKQ